MNRKGDERVLSLYWFVIFIIIAAAVTGATYLFFAHPLDVREVEVNILGDRVIDCFVENGKLRAGLLEDISSDNFKDKCGLKFEDSYSAYNNKNQYYIEVNISGKVVSVGDSVWKSPCTEDAKPNVPTCTKKKLMVLNETGDFVVFDFLASIRKVEQNV